MDFIAWPKTPRLEKETIIVTEKIDGTNASIYIDPEGTFLTGSRNRWITPEDDNYGFSRWAHDNKEELMKLGPGRHTGEWWGLGIQRGYNQTEKKFSLFNTYRDPESLPACVTNVPVLFKGQLSDFAEIDECVQMLKRWGSTAAPGFMNPEGVCVYFCTSKQIYKVPFGK